MKQEARQYSPGISLGLFVLALFAIVSISVRIHDIWVLSRFAAEGVSTQGRITNRFRERRVNTRYGIHSIRYQDRVVIVYMAEGVKYTSRCDISFGSSKLAADSDTVPLTYLKSDPRIFRIGTVSADSGVTGWGILSMILLVLLVVPFVMYEILRQREKRQMRR